MQSCMEAHIYTCTLHYKHKLYARALLLLTPRIEASFGRGWVADFPTIPLNSERTHVMMFGTARMSSNCQYSRIAVFNFWFCWSWVALLAGWFPNGVIECRWASIVVMEILLATRVATSIIGSDDLLETTEKVATAEYFDLLALDNQLFARLLQPRPLKSLIL